MTPKPEIKDILKKVKQFKINKDTNISSLISDLSNTGFSAKRLAVACEIYEAMINDEDCTKFFGLAGALIPAGFQGIIHDFIEESFIDVLVTTGASLTHDIAETLGYHHLQGDLSVKEVVDSELHNQELNR